MLVPFVDPTGFALVDFGDDREERCTLKHGDASLHAGTEVAIQAVERI